MYLYFNWVFNNRMANKVQSMSCLLALFFRRFSGGTVDCAVHEVIEDGNLREIYKASGGAWGGTKVDEAFIAFMEDITGISYNI